MQCSNAHCIERIDSIHLLLETNPIMLHTLLSQPNLKRTEMMPRNCRNRSNRIVVGPPRWRTCVLDGRARCCETSLMWSIWVSGPPEMRKKGLPWPTAATGQGPRAAGSRPLAPLVVPRWASPSGPSALSSLSPPLCCFPTALLPYPFTFLQMYKGYQNIFTDLSHISKLILAIKKIASMEQDIRCLVQYRDAKLYLTYWLACSSKGKDIFLHAEFSV
jgi:hypothetical protein